MRLDLRELVLHVVGVHGANLISSRCSQHLDDLYELVNARLAWEKRLSEHQLCHDATRRPDVCTHTVTISTHSQHHCAKQDKKEGRTNLGGVVCCSKNQLRRTVVPGANVRHVWLVFYQDLGTSEIAQLEDTRRRVEQQVLRLDVSVADALRVDVGERAEELVNVELDF